MNSLHYRRHRLWLIIGWGLVAAVIVLSLIPVPFELGEGDDKIGHFTAYASLAFWFGMLNAGLPRQLGIAAAFALMGVGIEFLQGMTDYRSFEVADMVANALGATLGFALLQTRLGNALTWAERFLESPARKG